jgi:ferredoxin
MSEQIANSTDRRNARARQAGLAAAADLSIAPTGLIKYQSHGHAAVIGGNNAIEIAERLNRNLQTQVLLLDGVDETGEQVLAVGGRELHIEGYLGAFRIQLGAEGEENAEIIRVDLILDLSPSPILSMPMKPPGYFAPAGNEEALESVIDELAQMVGSFEKPRYFEYDASICAHERSGKTACRRCIDACPAEAITSLAESIEVNSNLCQGGGICATVCPSGAISYNYPTSSDTLLGIKTLLHSYEEQGGRDPCIVFVSDAHSETPQLQQGNLLPVVVEELASTGLEVWLSTLAYGAKAVWLLDNGATPSIVMRAMEEQIRVAGEILAAMGFDPDAVRVITPPDLLTDLAGLIPEMTTASFSGVGGKRQTAYLAIDHLFDQAARPKPLASLSTGAPFGTAYVEQSCTLCFACVGSCPGRALQAGEGEPKLRFIEANCLQCGMCTRTCPENAIWITPRLLFDRSARQKLRTLYEEEPFCCTSCGKPFATRSVIDSMFAKLQGHWMFQDERARKRLTMCEDCRVVDAVQDPDAMESGINGQILQ